MSSTVSSSIGKLMLVVCLMLAKDFRSVANAFSNQFVSQLTEPEHVVIQANSSQYAVVQSHSYRERCGQVHANP